jgi:acetyl-CoA carboxylase beta subunit
MTRSPTTTKPGLADPSGRQAVWVSCPACGWLIYRKRLDRNLHVCPECDHHLRLSARARIQLLVDEGSFTETTFPPGVADPLAFTDLREYPDLLREARPGSAAPPSSSPSWTSPSSAAAWASRSDDG